MTAGAEATLAELEIDRSQIMGLSRTWDVRVAADPCVKRAVVRDVRYDATRRASRNHTITHRQFRDFCYRKLLFIIQLCVEMRVAFEYRRVHQESVSQPLVLLSS